MSAVLCIINNDEDCVIIPEKTCRSCLQRKMHMFILREITVSNEFCQSVKKLIAGKSCLCQCNINRGKFETIFANRMDDRYAMHWIIARQVLRRESNKLTQQYNFRALEPWYYEYFETYIDRREDLKHNYCKPD
jgi:hypothetical protein